MKNFPWSNEPIRHGEIFGMNNKMIYLVDSTIQR